MTAAVIAFASDKSAWFDDSIRRLKQTTVYQDYEKCVLKAESFDERLNIWKERETGKKGKKPKKVTQSNKIRFYVENNSIKVKINRFGHAMDPDRGIVTFVSAMLSTERAVFGIYSLVRPKSDKKGETFLSRSLNHISELRNKLDWALEKDEQSVPAWFENALRKKISEAVEKNLPLNSELDMTEELLANKRNISGRVILTICYFLDGLLLNFNGLKITWDRFRLLDTTRANFLDGLRGKFGFDVPSSPIPIQELTENCVEDEITYAIVHRVLLPNNFRIVSVSYPGAQGGAAVLPEPGAGKKQKRNYLDVVAFPPADAAADFDVLIDENKGMFAARKVEEDIEKLRKYQNEATYKTALETALIRAKVFDRNGKLHDIAIGVGFGVKEDARTTWNPADVDFIFRVKQRTEWQIGIFRQDLKELIAKVEGTTNLPVCYEVVPRARTAKSIKAKKAPKN